MGSSVWNPRSAAAAALASLLALSCQQPERQETNPEQRARIEQLQDLEQKREDRHKELAAMSVAELHQVLLSESERGLEPFNSTAYRELGARGRAGAAELRPLLQDGGRRSLLSLLALRQMDAGMYRGLAASFRVGVLIDALNGSKYFNTWGLPHVRWEEAARAIIEEGQAAEEMLKKLLSDRRPAPVWGSEDYLEYQAFQYRLRDYAWALLREIQGRRGEIPQDPAQRDRLIMEEFGM